MHEHEHERAIAVGPERQDQQNVRKLRGLNQDAWAKLVDRIDENRNQTPLPEVKRILDLEDATPDSFAVLM